MVAPHPELQRKINNTDNIVSANKSEFVPNLSIKYPGDYIDLNTHTILTTVKPWEEELTIATTMPSTSSPFQNVQNIQNIQNIQNVQNLWGPFFTTIDNVLVLCVDFSDLPAVTTRQTIENRFFSTTGDTFLNYYKEVSYSKWIPSGEVHGWYRAPQTYAYYIGTGNYGWGDYPNNVVRLVEDTIDMAIADSAINWALFDTNGNTKIDNIVVVHSGAEAAWSGSTNQFWAHAGTIFPQKSAGGKTIYQYVLTSEYIYSGASQRVGIDCHEFGHLLNLPDLYDTNLPKNSNGVGNYSLMANGCWANNGIKPVHLDAWSKYKLGFTNVTTDPQGLVTINNAEASDIAIKYTTADPKEYLLIENRQKTLFDTYLPSDGMLIWHINENQSNNNNEACFLVGLIQADGLKDLENKVNNGDTGDSYPGSTNNRIFGVYTTPNSLLCNGSTRDMSIIDISNSGNTMTFNSTAPAIPGPLPDGCQEVTIVTPPNITATDVTITKSANPCVAGTCTVTVNVTWKNIGGAVGTFTPSIIVDSGTPITSSSITLSPLNNAGDTIIHTFTLSNLTAATHSICPSPN